MKTRPPVLLCICFALLCLAGCRDNQASIHWGNELEQYVKNQRVHAKLSVIGNSSSEPLAAMLIVQGENIAPLRESISISTRYGIEVNGVPLKQDPEFTLYLNATDGSLKRIAVDPKEREIFQQNRDCTIEELLEFWAQRK